MENKDFRLLIVDDEHSVRDSLSHWFKLEGYLVDSAEDAKNALQKLQARRYDLVLLDIKMPGMDGMELQKRIKGIDPHLSVIIITAYATVETAVQALKEGAFDYITKPFDPDEFSHTVRNALRGRQLAHENVKLREHVEALSPPSVMVGESPPFREMLTLIERVAPTDTSVLIQGESGTGKELVVRATHAASPRRYFPLVPVSCGALPESLLESELFGHEKGAFTGAQYRRKGKIELAEGGTLFLDEIGDISSKTQIDLLRVLEDKQIQRIGSERAIPVNFRLICATNRNLADDVKTERFRQDLFYRIHVFEINVPPLRERVADIPLLVDHFIQKHASRMKRPPVKISSAALELLMQHNWPGNIRELENTIEHALVLTTGDTIQPGPISWNLSESPNGGASGHSLDNVEKQHIGRVLKEMKGNVSRAARILGIDRTTLYKKIQKYGLEK